MCATAGFRDMHIVTLKRRAEFLRVRGGARCATSAFVLETKARADDASGAAASTVGPRFGFTVTKKIGGAVVRNRIRRRLKAALRSLPVESALPGLDYVLIARTAAASCAFNELTSELTSALSRVHKSLQRGAGKARPSVRPPQPQPSGREGCDQGSAPAHEKT